MLSDDRTWRRSPLTAALAAPGDGDGALQNDLLELARRVPRLFDMLDELPQVMFHGDASPQNLLPTAKDPDEFVVIDWMLGGLAAVGWDLGQLLIGHAHAGTLRVEEMPALRLALADAYTAGLAEEGVIVDVAAVRAGLDAALVVRGAFTALPLERLSEPSTPALRTLIAERLRLTRYLVDVGLAASARTSPHRLVASYGRAGSISAAVTRRRRNGTTDHAATSGSRPSWT